MTIKAFFTPSEQKQILALREQGLSIRSISQKVHRCRTNIAIFINDPALYQKLLAEANATPAVKKIKTPKKSEAKKKSSATPSKTKTPKKFSKSPGVQTSTSKTPITIKDLAEYNKVKMEHRAVIKFLVRLGEYPKSIHSQLRKVYKPGHPDLGAVRYWAKQFRKGRQTILNDTETTQRILQVQKCKVLVSKSTGGKKTKSAAKKTKVVKKTSVQNGKLAESPKEEVSLKEEIGTKKAPAKKSFETSICTGPFTIKLPGMDRLSKALT